MRKIQRMVLHDAMRQLSSAQMQTLKGGAGDYVACVCSCNNAIGTWTTKCNVDSLGQDFYAYSTCGGNHYARCGAL